MRDRLQSSLAFAIAAFAALAACGGGGGSAVPPRPGTGSAAMGSASLSITVPTKSAAAKRAMTVSPLTQSVTVVVNGGAPQIFNTTPSSSNCSSGSSGLTCTFTVSAPFGSDTFVVTTYDQPNGAGNALNGSTIAASISPTGANTVTVPLAQNYVTNLSDSGTGSLRGVLAAVSANDTICFKVSGTITVLSTLAFTKNVTIDGTCPNSVTLDGGGTVQMFSVPSGVTVTIKGLTIQNGFASSAGGAITNAGTLTLDTDTFTGNKVNAIASPFGGAVASTGALTVTNSTFSNNSVTSTSANACGGAVSVLRTGTLSISGSTFTSNSTGGFSTNNCGGAVYAEPSFTITNSTFKNNSTNGSGGALMGPEATPSTSPVIATISHSLFDSNTVARYSGAWEYDTGNAFVDNTTFSNNSTTGTNTCCGAVGDFSGASPAPSSTYVASFTNDTFSNNSATGDSGAMEVDTTTTLISNTQFLNNHAGADSGAMELDGCPASGPGTFLVNDTFTGNTAAKYDSGVSEIDCATSITGGSFTNNSGLAGGALTVYDTTTITGSMFSGNTATGNIATKGGAGGAVLVGWNATITNATFTNNTATDVGGAIFAQCGTTIIGSTFKGNTTTATVAGDGGGAIYGYPYVSVSPTCPPTIAITNSTVTANTSALDGGGIYNAGLTLTLNFVTIASNIASGAGWNINNVSGPSGVTIQALDRHRSARRRELARVPAVGTPPPTTSISNSIVYASPHPGSDINNGGTMNGADYNVLFNAVVAGTPFADSPMNNITTDPLLAALAANGGPTQTMAIGSASPARGHVPAAACNVTTDQRGNARTAPCDSGAYQFP